MSLISKKHLWMVFQSTIKLFNKRIKDSTADWNQNDSSADNFVKNRTHWIEHAYNNVMPETTSNVDEAIGAAPFIADLVVGKTYRVKWNGSSHICTAYTVGDIGSLGGDSYPFWIDFFEGSIDAYPNDGSSTVTMAIDEVTEIIHKIPEKFLPDSVGGNADMTGYATERWVEDQNYLTAVPDGYAKTEDIPKKPEDIGALPNTYTPPNQTAEQVGADPNGTATTVVSQHNTADDSHNDIRLELKAINDRLTAFFDSDDKTLDELSEIVAYITSNKALIDSITTSKVSVADIINNLTSNVTNKPLSAAQGVVLKGLIDAVSNSLANYQPKGDYALRSELPNVPTKLSEFTNDSGFITGYTETDPTVPAWAKQSTKPSYSKSEVGLGNVDNVKQYSASNPPPYPVTSVNGKTGAVSLTIPTVPTKVSAFENDNGYLTQHQDISGLAKKNETVSVNVQTLTEAQKVQVRKNIGAASQDDIGKNSCAFYEQPEEPENAPVGALWFDTDEESTEAPGSGGNVDISWLDPEEGEVFTSIATLPDIPDEPDVPDIPEEPDIPVEPEVTLTGISATYTGGNVAVGTAVTALTGITVTAHYSDGSTEPVTGYTLSGEIADGSNIITVQYGGKTTTFTVTGVEEGNGEDFTGTENAFERDGYLYVNPLYLTPMFNTSKETAGYHKVIYMNNNGKGIFDNSAISDGTIFNGVLQSTASSADEPYYEDATSGNAWICVPLDDWNSTGGSIEAYLYSLTERLPIKMASSYSVFDFNNSDMETIIQGSKYKTNPSISNGFVVGAIFFAMPLTLHPVCSVSGMNFTSGTTECYKMVKFGDGSTWTEFHFSIPSEAFDNDLSNVSISSIVEYVRSIGLKFWGGAA